ncbi:hypothetical protein ACHAXT_006772 [Thalassiosira profunda]
MSASASVTVPVSTKTDDGSSSAASNPNMRRNSSSNSLDVAATIFSSMQELEASGRNLASLGLSALGGRPELGLEAGRGGGMGPPTAPLATGGLTGEAAALARLGALRSFPASRTNSSDSLAAMEKMLAATSAAGGGGYAGSIHAQADALRRLEMEEALLQQQGLSQRAALYGTLPGSYAPLAARRSPGGLDDFSPEELLREVERRQGQRRASREFATGMPGILSRDNSRDDLAALYKAEMYGQFRRGNTGGSSGAGAPGARRNSLDSLSSLALLASSAKNAAEQQQKEAANAAKEAAGAGNDASNDNDGKDANGKKKKGEDVVVMVPTSKPESKKVGKKAAKDTRKESNGTNSTVVTDTPSPKPPAKGKAVPTDNSNAADKLSGKKRNTSTASFDALLSVLGDDMSRQGVARTAGDDDDASAGSAQYFHHLVERTAHAAAAARQREEEDRFLATAAAWKRQRRASTESSLSDGLTPLGHRKPTLDVGALTGGAGGGSQDMLLAHMDALRQKSRGGMGGMSGMGGIPGLPPLDAPGFPGRPVGTAEYQRRFRDHADMMASLEALRRDEYLTKQRALREGRLRELQAQEARLGRLPLGAYPPGEMARLSALMGTHLAGGYGGPTPHHAMAAESMLARLQGLPVQHNNGGGRAGKRRAPKPKADPNYIRPDLALEQFLSRFDDKGKEARERLLGAIEATEGSLATIHEWDRSWGLRKCHSRTVVKTRRSRGRLKAFLMGVDPPKEPAKKKKKKKRGRRFVEYYDDDDY